MRPREDAHRILKAGLAAVDPRAAVRRSLDLEAGVLRIGEETVDLHTTGRVLVLGAGKAAPSMAQGVLDALGDRVTGGTITTKYGHARPLRGIEAFEAGHPVPDVRGEQGAGAALRLAKSAGDSDLVLCLLSGGASALWPAPAEGVSLADLQAVTDRLLRAGATIGRMNVVRKHLSRIAGGHLARAAAPARLAALVVSDVVGSPLDVIASGPTVPDHTTYADALAILESFGVEVPPSVRAHLRAGQAGQVAETPKAGDPAFERTSVHVVARNRDALEGASREAQRLGYHPLVLTTRLEGEAREVARVVAGLAIDVRDERIPVRPPAAILLGGETTVTVAGSGRGGRNQEMALAAAIALEGAPKILVACLGTDGTDGPTDAAGGMVDSQTVARGRELGLDAHYHLRSNDAYPYLEATGDLLVTGPTGTNVNDLTLLLVEAAGAD